MTADEPSPDRDTEQRWASLVPESEFVTALDRADAALGYSQADVSGTTNDKRNWSNRFADACAALLAPAVRAAMLELDAPRDLEVFPAAGGTSERPVLLGEGSRKRIDVAVVHRLGGLRIDISLKGLNFRDSVGDQFDKNLTGRTYELEDELRTVRRLQPATFVFALYFLPLEAAYDKASGESSFARTLVHLRWRVNRGLPSTPRPVDLLDGAAVALYAPVDTLLPSDERVLRGTVRCMDVLTDPPRRGRPRISSTHSLAEMIRHWVALYLDAIGATRPDWADPEAP